MHRSGIPRAKNCALNLDPLRTTSPCTNARLEFARPELSQPAGKNELKNTLNFRVLRIGTHSDLN